MPAQAYLPGQALSYDPNMPEPTEADYVNAFQSSNATRGFRASLLSHDANAAAMDYWRARQAGNEQLAAQRGLAAQALAQRAAVNAPRVQSVGDIHGLGDAGDYLAGMAGGLPAAVIPPVAMGLAGKLIGSRLGPLGALIGGHAGGVAGMALPETDAAAMQQFQAEQAGAPAMDPNDAIPSFRQEGWTTGAIYGATSPVAGAMRSVAGLGAKVAAKDAVSGVMPRIGREAVHGVGSMVAAEKVKQLFESDRDPNRRTEDDNMRLLDAGVSGAALAVPFGVAGHVGDVAHSALNYSADMARSGGGAALDAAQRGGRAALDAAPGMQDAVSGAVDRAIDNMPQTRDEWVQALGQGASKLHGAADDALARVILKGYHPDLDTLMKSQKGMDRRGMEADDLEKHSSAVRLAESVLTIDDAPDSVRSAADGYLKGSRTQDSYRQFKYALTEWQVEEQTRDALRSFGKSVGDRALNAADKGLDKVAGKDERQNAQAPRTPLSPFETVVFESMRKAMGIKPGSQLDADVAEASRDIQKYILSGFREPGDKHGHVWVPSELQRILKDPATTITDITDLMVREGKIKQDVAEANLQELLAELRAEGLHKKSSAEIVRSTLVPTAEQKYKITPKDHAGIAQAIMDSVTTGKFNEPLLEELFGSNKEMVVEAIGARSAQLKKYSRGHESGGERKEASTQDDEAYHGGDENADESIRDDEGRPVIPDMEEPIVKWHGYNGDGNKPYKVDGVMFDKTTHDAHAANKSGDLETKNSSVVKRQGYIDYLKEMHGEEDPVGLSQAINAFVAEHQHELTREELAHRDVALNKKYFMLREENKGDKADTVDIPPGEFGSVTGRSPDDGGSNTWGLVAGKDNKYATVDNGRIWFRRGDGVEFNTSVAKIIDRIKAAKYSSEVTEATGPLQSHDMLMAGISSMLHSGWDERQPDGSTKRHYALEAVGVLHAPGKDSAIQWLGHGKDLPDTLKIFDQTVGSMRAERIKTHVEKMVRELKDALGKTNDLRDAEAIRTALADTKDVKQLQRVYDKVTSKAEAGRNNGFALQGLNYEPTYTSPTYDGPVGGRPGTKHRTDGIKYPSSHTTIDFKKDYRPGSNWDARDDAAIALEAAEKEQHRLIEVERALRELATKRPTSDNMAALARARKEMRAGKQRVEELTLAAQMASVRGGGEAGTANTAKERYTKSLDTANHGPEGQGSVGRMDTVGVVKGTSLKERMIDGLQKYLDKTPDNAFTRSVDKAIYEGNFAAIKVHYSELVKRGVAKPLEDNPKLVRGQSKSQHGTAPDKLGDRLRSLPPLEIQSTVKDEPRVSDEVTGAALHPRDKLAAESLRELEKAERKAESKTSKTHVPTPEELAKKHAEGIERDELRARINDTNTNLQRHAVEHVHGQMHEALQNHAPMDKVTVVKGTDIEGVRARSHKDGTISVNKDSLTTPLDWANYSQVDSNHITLAHEATHQLDRAHAFKVSGSEKFTPIFDQARKLFDTLPKDDVLSRWLGVAFNPREKEELHPGIQRAELLAQIGAMHSFRHAMLKSRFEAGYNFIEKVLDYDRRQALAEDTGTGRGNTEVAGRGPQRNGAGEQHPTSEADRGGVRQVLRGGREENGQTYEESIKQIIDIQKSILSEPERRQGDHARARKMLEDWSKKLPQEGEGSNERVDKLEAILSAPEKFPGAHASAAEQLRKLAKGEGRQNAQTPVRRQNTQSPWGRKTDSESLADAVYRIHSMSPLDKVVSRLAEYLKNSKVMKDVKLPQKESTKIEGNYDVEVGRDYAVEKTDEGYSVINHHTGEKVAFDDGFADENTGYYKTHDEAVQAIKREGHTFVDSRGERSSSQRPSEGESYISGVNEETYFGNQHKIGDATAVEVKRIEGLLREAIKPKGKVFVEWDSPDGDYYDGWVNSLQEARALVKEWTGEDHEVVRTPSQRIPFGDDVPYSSQRPSEGQSTHEEQMKVIADGVRRLGKDFKAAFVGELFGKNAAGERIPISGDWHENIMRVSVYAENPSQIGAHEHMHEFMGRLMKATLNDGNKTAERVGMILARAADSAPVVRQLQRLLIDHPEALKQIENGAPHAVEERLAYMFQFHQAGLLTLGPETTSTFTKIANFFRRVVGLLSDDQKADAILRAFNEGRMPTADAAAEVLANSIEYRERIIGKFNEAISPVTSRVQRAVGMAANNLEKSDNPFVKEIGRQIKTPTGESGEQSLLEAKDHQFKLWTNRLSATLRDLNPKDLDLAAKYLYSGERSNDAIVNGLIDKIKGEGGLLPKFHDYLREAGVSVQVRQPDGKMTWEPIGKVENYFTRAWDTHYTLEHSDEAIALLHQHHEKELQSILDAAIRETEASRHAGYQTASHSAKIDIEQGRFKDRDDAAANLTTDDIAQAIVARIINGNGQAALSEVPNELGFSPYMRSVNRRTLNFIDTSKFTDFMDKDVARVLTTYLAQGVKRAESTRRFGPGGEKLQRAMDKAQAFELDKLIKAKYGVEGASDKARGAISAVKSLGEEASTFDEELAKTINFSNSEAKLDAEDARKLNDEARNKLFPVTKDIMAMEGTLGYDVDPRLRRVQNGLMAYQNMRTMALSGFSQLIDPMGIVIRGGTMSDAFDAYKRGIKEVLASWKGEHTSDEQARIAEEVGTADAHGALAAFGQLHSSLYLGAKFRKANDMLFKVNGMEGFNRGMQISATQAAIGFIKKHSLTPGKHSEAYLAELNLKAEDVKVGPDGNLDYTDPKIQQAIHRWVNGAILRPNAGQRPAWASDPHYAVFWHMKQFAYTFHDVTLKRVVNDLKKYDDLGPAAVLALAYTPIMIAADATKAILLTGKEPSWMAQGLPSMLEHGSMRAGLTGMWQPVTDTAVSGRSWAGLAGPSVEQLTSAFTHPLSETAVQALPGASVINTIHGNAHMFSDSDE